MTNISGQFMIHRLLLLELLRTLMAAPAKGGCRGCFGLRRLIGRDPSTMKAWALPCPYCTGPS